VLLSGGGAHYSQVNKTNSWESMSDCHWVRPSALDYMGYSMRTDTHRIIIWYAWDGDKLLPDWGKVVGRELYDHSKNSQLDNSYLLCAIPHRVAHLLANRIMTEHKTLVFA
jgi:hypothetical protein